MDSRASELRLSSGSLHVLLRGESGAPPAVCIPGLSANARSFDVIAGALARSGRRTAALDLRGRGLSPATGEGTYGWRRHAEDVLEAADRLGFSSFDVIGHSMGAFVAMQIASLAPARIGRTVLIDAVGRPDPEALPSILASVQRLGVVYPSADFYCEMIHALGAAEPWEQLWEAHFRSELEPGPGGGVRPRTSREAVVEDLAYGANHDASELWPALLCAPTLLVRAAKPLGPGAGFVVGAALRDRFLGAVRTAEAVDVDANHYGVVAHAGALEAIGAFLARERRPVE